MKITILDNQTGVNAPNAVGFNAYYSNGVLKVADYTGRIKVYNLSGTVVTEGQALFGQYTGKTCIMGI